MKRYFLERVISNMDVSNMKNIVVLKNLPSNIVDEAIVILKSNKKAKKLEYIDKSTKSNYDEKNISKDYLVKEAESVISNYIAKVESGRIETNKVYNKNIEKKYRKLKIYSLIASIVLVMCIIRTFLV